MVYFRHVIHYSHANICRGTSKWDRFEKGGSHQQTRDFNTLEEMNAAIVKGINSKVKYDDVLYHLGDWCFKSIDEIWNFRKQLICKNIHLIFGNHDHHIETSKILPNCHTGYNHLDEKGNYITLDGKPERNELAVSSQDLFASTQYVKTIKAGNTTLFLSHYAHRVWDKSHHNRIHLYAHSHGTLEDQPYGRSMDVGIDNYYRLYKKYEPFSLTQILEIMAKRDVLLVDHHNKNTN